MIALVAKIIAMGILGYNIIPVVFIIPVFAMISIACSIALIKSVRNNLVERDAPEFV